MSHAGRTQGYREEVDAGSYSESQFLLTPGPFERALGYSSEMMEVKRPTVVQKMEGE